MAQNSKNKSGDKSKLGKFLNQELQDSPHDEELMKSETVTIDLPDVKDIPGQEHVMPLPLGEMADTTISSSDEEGTNIFEDQEEESDLGIVMGNDADVSSPEKKSLQRASEDVLTTDENNLRSAALDNTDEEGIPLNEKGFGADITGKELDVPGADDDASEDIGEEDEENNTYSIDDNEDESVNS